MVNENALYLHEDVRDLLKGKKLIVMGDSIQRSVYKDLVCLYCQKESRYLTESELRKKGEKQFQSDTLLSGGEFVKTPDGLEEYREVREFKDEETVFRFYFITRCYNDYVDSVMNEFKTLKPHVLIINSCYWDIHRYQQGKEQYKANLEKLLKAATELPQKPLFIWSSALPLAKYCKGGFLRKGFKTLPLEDILKANREANEAVNKFDNAFYLDLCLSVTANPIFEQASDGIHWGHRAHRKMSNSILSVVSTQWGKKIPTREQVLPQLDHLPLAQGPNPWPYYPEDSYEDYDEDYENEYDYGGYQWENRPPSPFIPPHPLQDRFFSTPSPPQIGMGFFPPNPWDRRFFQFPPNDRYFDWVETPPPLMVRPLTPGNARPPRLHQRHFSDPLPRYLPHDFGYGPGFLEPPQLPQSHYKNRFKKHSVRNRKKPYSSTSTPMSRQTNSTPLPGSTNSRNASAALGASPVLPTKGVNKDSSLSNSSSISEAARELKMITDTNNNNKGKSTETTTLEDKVKTSTDSELVTESSDIVSSKDNGDVVEGRKRKRDDAEEEEGTKECIHAPPEKQAKQDKESVLSSDVLTMYL